MGCDGGTIPRRDELVRTKKKPEQKDKDSELSFRWQHCAISQQPLQQPIVACGLGRLYNKDTVIEGLLDRSSLPEVAQHIKNLKDVKELKLTPNPAFKNSAEKGDAYIDRQCSPYICPVIGLEMNGKFKFVFSWSCGCVVSERALKEIQTKVCHKCQQPFLEEDIVILNATDDDQDLMVTRLDSRQARLKAEKKAKSEAKAKAKASTLTTTGPDPTPSTSGSTVEIDKKPVELKNNGVQKIDMQKADKKSDTSKISVKGPKRLGSEADLVDPEFKKTKGSYSIAKDPNASKVYKSLFTSHSRASQQTKAHWVTYNPFYN
ncbi:Uncharacterized protein GBIM_12753 [Gryllus bimaculatus]|nr:Uncharacterized protein GBIM_12753 [Gryllus bimaculatus]